MDCSLPGSSVHEFSQARILEWVVASFSRGSSQQRLNSCLLHFRVGYLSLSHRGARPLFLWLLLNKIHRKLKHNTSKPRLILIPKLFVPPLVPISVKRPPSTKVFKLETWGTCLTALLPNPHLQDKLVLPQRQILRPSAVCLPAALLAQTSCNRCSTIFPASSCYLTSPSLYSGQNGFPVWKQQLQYTGNKHKTQQIKLKI